MIRTIINYLPSVVIPTIVSLITTVMYGNYMKPEYYGEYNIFVTTISITYTLLFSFISSATLRFYNSFEIKNEQYKIISTYIITASILLTVLLIVLFPIKGFESILIVSCIGAIGFYNIYSNLLRASENTFWFNIVRASVPIGTLAIVLYFVWKNSLDTFASVLSLYLPMAVISLIIGYICFRKGLIRITLGYDKKLLKDSVTYGVPLAFSGLLNLGLSSSDRYLISYFLGSKEVGIYSFAYRIAELSMVNVTMIIVLALYPQLVKAYDLKGKRKAQELLNKYLSLHFVTIIPVAIIIILYVDELMNTIFPVYKEGIMIVKLTIIGTFFFTISAYTDKVFQLTKSTSKILVILLISGIVNFILNVILIPIIGVKGAVVATIFSYVLYIILSVVNAKKHIKIVFPFKNLLYVLVLNALIYIFINLTIERLYINDLSRAILGIVTYISLYSILIYVIYKYKKRTLNK